MDYGPAFKGTYIFSISEIKVSLREPRSAESDTCVITRKDVQLLPPSARERNEV